VVKIGHLKKAEEKTDYAAEKVGKEDVELGKKGVSISGTIIFGVLLIVVVLYFRRWMRY
jgi:hypothetical protein